MRRRLIAVATAAACATAAGGARAEEIAHGKVVQVTATEVYVDLGAQAGVRPGDVVDIDTGRAAPLQLAVVDVGPAAARVRLPGDAAIPKVGAAVTAPRRPPPTPPPGPKIARLEPPRSLAALATRWDGLDTARAERVTYAAAAAPGAAAPSGGGGARISGTVAIDYLGLVDLGGTAGTHYHRIGLRSDLDVADALGGWLGYSHRLRLRLDFAPDLDGRPFSAARNTLYVYRLRASMDLRGFHAELGRTAAAPIPGASLIDGATAHQRIGEHVYVGAFGGLAPVITDLGVTTDASRFGAYGSLRLASPDPDGWRLSADAGVIGTTFDGEIDRRAIAARATLADRDRWLHGQAVLDFFPSGHPAGRPPGDPSVLILDAGARLTPWLRASARVDHFRAARTREALATLPPKYASSLAFSSVRGSLDLSLPHGIQVGAFAGWRHPTEGADALWTGADLRAGSIFFGDDRVALRLDAALGRYQDSGAGSLRYTIPLHARVDLSTRYRLLVYRYGSENQRLLRHSMSLGADANLGKGVRASVDVDASFGDEERVLTALGTIVFRF